MKANSLRGIILFLAKMSVERKREDYAEHQTKPLGESSLISSELHISINLDGHKFGGCVAVYFKV